MLVSGPFRMFRPTMETYRCYELVRKAQLSNIMELPRDQLGSHNGSESRHAKNKKLENFVRLKNVL